MRLKTVDHLNSQSVGATVQIAAPQKKYSSNEAEISPHRHSFHRENKQVRAAYLSSFGTHLKMHPAFRAECIRYFNKHPLNYYGTTLIVSGSNCLSRAVRRVRHAWIPFVA